MDQQGLWDQEPVLSRRERLRREREAEHRRPVRARLRITAAVALVTALAVWLAVSWLTSSPSASETLPDPPELPDDPRPREEPDGGHRQNHPDHLDHPDQDTDPEATILVHVAGAVTAPGVVELEPDSRVQDAVDAAGGPAEDAALDALNLAEQPLDGAYLRVPTRQELDDGELPELPNRPGEGHSGETTGLIDVNTAEASSLEELPGVGPALAERIIAHREDHGPFGSVEDLVAVRGIGPAIIADVQDLVTW